jgi:hypothetical protein
MEKVLEGIFHTKRSTGSFEGNAIKGVLPLFWWITG